VDLGPEGGDEGGHLVAAGTPEQIINVPESHTGRYLKDVLAVGRANAYGIERA
jgi:excinuclease ABC subunit A